MNNGPQLIIPQLRFAIAAPRLYLRLSEVDPLVIRQLVHTSNLPCCMYSWDFLLAYAQRIIQLPAAKHAAANFRFASLALCWIGSCVGHAGAGPRYRHPEGPGGAPGVLLLCQPLVLASLGWWAAIRQYRSIFTLNIEQVRC